MPKRRRWRKRHPGDFLFLGSDPHVTADGRAVRIFAWEVACLKCDAPFVWTTPADPPDFDKAKKRCRSCWERSAQGRAYLARVSRPVRPAPAPPPAPRPIDPVPAVIKAMHEAWEWRKPWCRAPNAKRKAVACVARILRSDWREAEALLARLEAEGRIVHEALGPRGAAARVKGYRVVAESIFD